MKNKYPIFTLFGITVYMHITFLLLVFYFFVRMGIPGVFVVLAIFACVLMHEFSHCLAAKYYGIKVNMISLLPIGGVAHMSRIPRKPIEELVISIAGPLSNFILAFLLYIILHVISGNRIVFDILMFSVFDVRVITVCLYLIQINLILGLFNMIPAFPMDGGRIFRSILAFFMDYLHATRVAVWVGRAFAVLFFIYGLVYNHIMLALIAVFIYLAAYSEYNSVMVSQAHESPNEENNA